MAVSSLVNRNNYTGNGSASVFTYGFRILDQSQLTVTVKDSADLETTLVITTDYTVQSVGSNTGTITLVNAGQAWLSGGNLATGYTMSIRRILPLTQATDIRNQGTFYPEVHEDQFDRQIMISQQQQDALDRSVKMPETVDPATFDSTVPASIVGQAGALLQVNSGGNGWTVAASSIVGATVTPYMETVLDDLDAASARTTLGALASSAGAVGPTNLAALAVTTAKIDNLAVDSTKLAANAVTTAKITDANVTAAKLAESVYAIVGAWGGTSGASSGTTYTATPSPAFTAYTTGMAVTFKADALNTGASTLNVNGLGAKNLKDAFGTALVKGVLFANQMVTAVYDGTEFKCVGVRVPIQNEIVMDTNAAMGSTNTAIARWTNVTVNTGTAMTLTQSAANGDSITINEPGTYVCSYDCNINTQAGGISKNSNQLTTSIGSITQSHILNYVTSGINLGTVSVSSTFYAAAGDVIRAHNTVSAALGFRFRITRVN